MTQTISIIGLGWLGLPLAKALKADGFNVKGSKSSSEGVEKVLAEGIDCQLFNTTLDFSLRESGVRDLFNCDTMIVTLPPNAHHGVKKYPSIVKALGKTAHYCGVKRLIFTGSISVYGDQTGNLTEEAILDPVSDSGKAIQVIEDALIHEVNIPVTILRLGGLIGADRHPARALSGRNDVKNPHHPVNLVHQNDVIEMIKALVKSDWESNQIYNVVADSHPTRIDYYTNMADTLGISAPIFVEDAESAENKNNRETEGKVIDGSKITRDYGVHYTAGIY